MRVPGTAYERFGTNFPRNPGRAAGCRRHIDPEYMAMAQVQVNNLIDAVAHLN